MHETTGHWALGTRHFCFSGRRIAKTPDTLRARRRRQAHETPMAVAARDTETAGKARGQERRRSPAASAPLPRSSAHLPDTPPGYPPELERVEVAVLLEAVFRHYGFDFRSYAFSSVKRRLWKRIHAEGLATVSQLQDRVLHDPDALERLLLDLSINVTAMFRDPGFYRAFRTHVVPLLRTYPFIRVWHAGCSTGEEVYSMAIPRQEERPSARPRICPPDRSGVGLQGARAG